MVVVSYTRLDADGVTEIVIHQEYNTKQEAITSADALALASVNNEEVIQVMRGQRISDTEVGYNVTHEIHRNKE